MTTPQPGSRTTRQRAERAFQVYRVWFFATFFAWLTFLVLFRQRQDIPSDFLLETAAHSVENSAIANVSARSLHVPTKNRTSSIKIATNQVHFLNSSRLHRLDGFSASWLQSRADFMTMPFDRVHSCEMASFRAYDGSRLPKMRMTYDWMDWSVEHLSRWWKILEWDLHQNDTIAYDSISSKLRNYISSAAVTAHNNDNNLQGERVLQNTLAVIAFQSYKHATNPQLGHNLTALSLAATMESLRRAGMGRVVVGILVDADIAPVQDAFRFLKQQVDPPNQEDNSNESNLISTIGHMEVAYAFSSAEFIKTKLLNKNMPRSTLMTLQQALNHTLQVPKKEWTMEMHQNVTAWLGITHDPSFWQYVYLTEPDTILTTRPGSLPAIKEEVDKGGVILPHRWQPIPHESDVKGMDPQRGTFLLQDEFPNVLTVHEQDACCDENAGPNFKPGLPPHYPLCRERRAIFWYACGFHEKMRHLPDKHERLSHYQLMRLMDGTGITTIVGTEHGRRCIPQKGACGKPKM
ncbi:expressed unknown protein [Seminavis robusta]|uniref:Uncharacterized protein n=1 Tax=Seminavis robusta TaxID=568900 RepID=A0A9N8ECM4_9STRA|nr:expressed unknown protein [Seminavis robusta]|eukprot:Sro927_g221110.1 n/a (520) ;mRNA; f:5864-7423